MQTESEKLLKKNKITKREREKERESEWKKIQEQIIERMSRRRKVDDRDLKVNYQTNFNLLSLNFFPCAFVLESVKQKKK
jgi:hypothetical protein